MGRLDKNLYLCHMRRWRHTIELAIFSGVVMSLLFVSYRAVRGHYVAIDKTEYLFPGDSYCEELGYINVGASKAWLNTRYQLVREENGELHLAYDWMEVIYNLGILFVLLSIVSFLSLVCISKREIANRK